MSLKSNLNQIIRDLKGEILTLKELEDYCHKAQYKLSNAERRLRPSESPDVERITKNGAIIGYRLRTTEPEVKIPDWFFLPTIKPEKQKLF